MQNEKCKMKKARQTRRRKSKIHHKDTEGTKEEKGKDGAGVCRRWALGDAVPAGIGAVQAVSRRFTDTAEMLSRCG